jgi:hypothetical protein
MTLKKNQKFLLVEGCPRSGTGILRHLLNSHPEIALTHESNILKIGLQSFVEHLKNELPDKQSTTYVGDKFPDYILEHNRIFELFPDALIIHIVRNPVDVLNSMMSRRIKSKQGMDPTWNSALSLNDGIAYWKFCWSVLQKDEKTVAVKYEDLTNQPEKELGHLADLLGLENSFDVSLLGSLPKPGTIRALTASQVKLVNRQLGYFIGNWQLPLQELKAKGPTIQKPVLMKVRVRMKAALFKLHKLANIHNRP